LLLLLLELQLPLLHLLQHLLRCLYLGLIPLLGLLIPFGRLGLICGVIRGFLRRIRVRRISSLLRSHVRYLVHHRLHLRRLLVAGGCVPARSRSLGHEDDARQHAGLLWRTKKHVVEPGSIQQFSDYFLSRTWPEMGYHPVSRCRNINIRPSLLAHRAQNVTQG
jgi:hypothetical protein